MSLITGKVNQCEALVLGYGAQSFEHSVAPVGDANFLGPSVETFRACSVHLGNRAQTPAPSNQHNCCLFPGTRAMVDFLSSTRNPDQPLPNQTAAFTVQHKGISKNRFLTPRCTPCPPWFNPSLDQSSTSNRASQPLQVFARTGLGDSGTPSAMPITLAEC